MLFYSDALNSEGTPAVIGFAAERVGLLLRVEALCVTGQVPPGPMSGSFVSERRGEVSKLTVEWPIMPWHETHGRLHPSAGWTPPEIIETISGVDYVQLLILKEESKREQNHWQNEEQE